MVWSKNNLFKCDIKNHRLEYFECSNKCVSEIEMYEVPTLYRNIIMILSTEGKQIQQFENMPEDLQI